MNTMIMMFIFFCATTFLICNDMKVNNDIKVENLKVNNDIELQQAKTKKDREEPFEDYDTLMRMLDGMIDRSFTVKYMLNMDLYDKVIIKDFENDSKEMIHEIINSIGSGVWEDLEFYHTREYIIKYTTRRINDLLMKFIREKKITIKPVALQKR